MASRMIVYLSVLLGLLGSGCFAAKDHGSGSKCAEVKVDGGDCSVKRVDLGDGDILTFQTCRCNPGLTMNVDKRTRYICKFDKNTSAFRWRADPKQRLKRRYTKVFLDEVKCRETCESFNVPEGMEIDLHSDVKRFRYPSKKFFVGDTLDFKCGSGYEDGDVDYYSDLSNITKTLTCEEGGLWDVDVPIEDVDFGVCAEITCDASKFLNMSNVRLISNQTTYGYMEEIMLECDSGYIPRGPMSLICVNGNSFREAQDGNTFGCQAIKCPEPPSPLQGSVDFSGLSVGDNATFSCNKGRPFGAETWVCQKNGRWDHECVVCVSDDDFCPPPCITTGVQMTTYPVDLSLGSTLSFHCSGEEVYVDRTCLKNQMWTGKDLDCTGIKDFNPHRTWRALTKALDTIATKANTSTLNQNDTSIEGKTIHVGAEGGSDIYFLLDVSKSVDANMFNKTKAFVKALLPHIGINDGDDGTRMAIYPFASKLYRWFEGTEDNILTDDIEAQEKFDELDRKEIIKETEQGTAIAMALEEVYTAIGTKLQRKNDNIRTPSFTVVILISDGEYTTSGDPQENGNQLKEFRNKDGSPLELYSIFIGKKESVQGRENMKQLSSGKDHFFAINSVDDDLDSITQAMISSEEAEGQMQCGTTDPALTIDVFANENGTVDEHNSKEDAWPWIVQIRYDNKPICGGSIIDEKWILTAAHCFDNGKAKISIVPGAWQLNDDRYEPEYINEDEVFIHEEYSKNNDVRYANDIALIKPNNGLPMAEKHLNPICYTPSDLPDIDFKPGRVGQVIGWGSPNAVKDDILTQIQVEVKDDCPLRDPEAYDETIMFCAGGVIDEKRVDTYGGDSGGPFMMHPLTGGGRFRQVGIVSFGDKHNGEDVGYGVYTRLSAYIDWINKTMTNN